MGVVVVVAAVVVVVVVVAGEPSAACTGGTPGASSQLRRPGRKKEKEILERSVNPTVGRRPRRFLLAFLATALGCFFFVGGQNRYLSPLRAGDRCQMRGILLPLPRNVSVEFFPFQLPPRRIARHNTRFWSPKRIILTQFS